MLALFSNSRPSARRAALALVAACISSTSSAALAQAGACNGDVNGDGSVDAADLADVLFDWGPCAAEPSIASIYPSAGVANVATPIAIVGTDLGGTTSVTVGGVEALDVTVVSSTVVTATVPAGTPGTKEVVLHVAGSKSTATSEFRHFVTSLGWATVLEQDPDPAVVWSASHRAAIAATGYPWRVRDNGTQIEMLLIPPGTFSMGCSASNAYGCYGQESPVHAVTLTSAYYVGRYEVTQAQWTAVMGSNPSYFTALYGYPGSDLRPVEFVSWNTIQGFLSATGLQLPSEAEWEYACRAGTSTAFHGFTGTPGGTNIDSVLGGLAWYAPNAGGETHPVGQKSANGFGLHDMSGNVREWVRDWYSVSYYASSPSTNPLGPPSGETRVLRGGSCWENANIARSSSRTSAPPGASTQLFGFRVARAPA